MPGHVFLLSGGLGAGKTCLTQGILWGLGGEEHARSPTFVLVSRYHARLTLYHVDLYRVDAAEEMDDLGLDEYVYGDGVCVVEWADKAPGMFPEDRLEVRIELLGESTRRLTLSASGQMHSEVLDAVTSGLAGGADTPDAGRPRPRQGDAPIEEA